MTTKTCPHCQQPYGVLPSVGDMPKTKHRLPTEEDIEKIDTKLQTTVGRIKLIDFTSEDNKLPPPQPSAFEDRTGLRVVAPLQGTHTDIDPFTNSLIGSAVTICVYFQSRRLYDAHRLLLRGIQSAAPTDRVKLRVATHSVDEQLTRTIVGLSHSGMVEKLVNFDARLPKYQAMRRLFQDLPKIDTNWTLWLDDDCHIRDPEWLFALLREVIRTCEPKNCGIYGTPYTFPLSTNQRAWIKSRPWYKGRQFRMDNGSPAPNGDRSVFPVSSLMLLKTPLIYELGIPDHELNDVGGDYIISEQVWQAGYTLGSWNGGEKYVRYKIVKRDEPDEKHPGEDYNG